MPTTFEFEFELALALALALAMTKAMALALAVAMPMATAVAVAVAVAVASLALVWQTVGLPCPGMIWHGSASLGTATCLEFGAEFGVVRPSSTWLGSTCLGLARHGHVEKQPRLKWTMPRGKSIVCSCYMALYR